MIKDNLIFYSYKIISLLLRITPKFCKKVFAKFLAEAVYIVDKKHRNIVFKNLEFFMPEVTEQEVKIAKKTYINFATYLIDTVEGAYRTKTEINKMIVEKNKYILENLFINNQQFIIMTGHFGYWELIAHFISANYKQLTTIGKRFGDSQKLTKALIEHRAKFGIETLLKRGAMKGFIKAIKDKKSVAILPDQSTINGIKVDFFGRELLWIDTIARLALQFNIAIVPTFITSKDNINFEIEYFEPMFPDPDLDKEQDAKRLSQYQASSLEQMIKKYPDHYFWFHKRAKREYPDLYLSN